jgi:hypothetical protein
LDMWKSAADAAAGFACLLARRREIDHVYEFAKDVIGRYSVASRPAQRVHFVSVSR